MNGAGNPEGPSGKVLTDVIYDEFPKYFLGHTPDEQRKTLLALFGVSEPLPETFLTSLSGHSRELRTILSDDKAFPHKELLLERLKVIENIFNLAPDQPAF